MIRYIVILFLFPLIAYSQADVTIDDCDDPSCYYAELVFNCGGTWTWDDPASLDEISTSSAFVIAPGIYSGQCCDDNCGSGDCCTTVEWLVGDIIPEPFFDCQYSLDGGTTWIPNPDCSNNIEICAGDDLAFQVYNIEPSGTYPSWSSNGTFSNFGTRSTFFPDLDGCEFSYNFVFETSEDDCMKGGRWEYTVAEGCCDCVPVVEFSDDCEDVLINVDGDGCELYFDLGGEIHFLVGISTVPSEIVTANGNYVFDASCLAVPNAVYTIRGASDSSFDCCDIPETVLECQNCDVQCACTVEISGPTTVCNDGTNYQYTVMTSGCDAPLNAIWIAFDGSTFPSPTNVISYPGVPAGTGQLGYRVTDANGCIAEDFLTVTVEDCGCECDACAVDSNTGLISADCQFWLSDHTGCTDSHTLEVFFSNNTTKPNNPNLVIDNPDDEFGALPTGTQCVWVDYIPDCDGCPVISEMDCCSSDPVCTNPCNPNSTVNQCAIVLQNCSGWTPFISGQAFPQNTNLTVGGNGTITVTWIDDTGVCANVTEVLNVNNCDVTTCPDTCSPNLQVSGCDITWNPCGGSYSCTLFQGATPVSSTGSFTGLSNTTYTLQCTSTNSDCNTVVQSVTTGDCDVPCNCNLNITNNGNCTISWGSTSGCNLSNCQINYSATGTGWSSPLSTSCSGNNFQVSQDGFYRFVATDPNCGTQVVISTEVTGCDAPVDCDCTITANDSNCILTWSSSGTGCGNYSYALFGPGFPSTPINSSGSQAVDADGTWTIQATAPGDCVTITEVEIVVGCESCNCVVDETLVWDGTFQVFDVFSNSNIHQISANSFPQAATEVLNVASSGQYELCVLESSIGEMVFDISTFQNLNQTSTSLEWTSTYDPPSDGCESEYDNLWNLNSFINGTSNNAELFCYNFDCVSNLTDPITQNLSSVLTNLPSVLIGTNDYSYSFTAPKTGLYQFKLSSYYRKDRFRINEFDTGCIRTQEGIDNNAPYLHEAYLKQGEVVGIEVLECTELENSWKISIYFPA